MIPIHCLNPNCSSPTQSFEWDVSQYVEAGGGIAPPRAQGAVRVIADCPYCAAENPVWVYRAKKQDVVIRGGKNYG